MENPLEALLLEFKNEGKISQIAYNCISNALLAGHQICLNITNNFQKTIEGKIINDRKVSFKIIKRYPPGFYWVKETPQREWTIKELHSDGRFLDGHTPEQYEAFDERKIERNV